MCVPGGPGQYDRGGGSDLKTGPLGQKGGEEASSSGCAFLFSSAKVQQSHPLLSSLLFPGESWRFGPVAVWRENFFWREGGGTDAERNGFFLELRRKGGGKV